MKPIRFTLGMLLVLCLSVSLGVWLIINEVDNILMGPDKYRKGGVL